MSARGSSRDGVLAQVEKVERPDRVLDQRYGDESIQGLGHCEHLRDERDPQPLLHERPGELHVVGSIRDPGLETGSPADVHQQIGHVHRVAREQDGLIGQGSQRNRRIARQPVALGDQQEYLLGEDARGGGPRGSPGGHDGAVEFPVHDRFFQKDVLFLEQIEMHPRIGLHE